jgi:hypothetical protein
VLAVAALALPAAAAPSRAATAAEVALELTTLAPAVARTGQDLVISGTLHNDGATPLAGPVVAVVMPTDEDAVRSTREAVRAWAAQTGPSGGTVIGQTRLPGTVPAGGTTPFSVTVPRLASLGPASYGAIPLSVQTGTASVRTFAGYQRAKQYEPISISWAVPLTLDPDPSLFGGRGAAREAAWSQALADGSRVNRVLDATQDAPVTWAIDPTLTPGLLSDARDVDDATQGDQETALRSTVQKRIEELAPRHSPWVLPDTDADLAAVAGAATGEALMRTLVGRSRSVAEQLGGRSDVAWPADGGYTATREAALRRMFRVPAMAGQVTSASVLKSAGSANTPGAAQRSTTGLPLLAYDDALSALLARTTSTRDGVLSTQQFVADSAALLNELPGTEGRTVFVAAPRSFNPDPAAARSFFDAAASIPWLTPMTTDATIAKARRAVTTAAAPVTRPTTAPVGGRAVLTTARIAQLERTVRTVHGVAQIRDDGDEFLRTWTRAAEQLASTRWRAAPTAWNTLSGRVSDAAKQTTTALKVSASTINFLADSGRLQITVTNDLAVPVQDVKLTVEASNPRLRIDRQPPVLRIGPKSRATVSVSVTALAAGQVPLRTTLTTPDGTVIGQGADVQVRVTPTGNWVYWGLGGLALLILLLGVVRTVRRRPGSRPQATPPNDPTAGSPVGPTPPVPPADPLRREATSA